VQKVEDWLKSLGLGEYGQRFAENDIDWSILAEISDADLEKIGVRSLGHRKRLLKAIGELSKAPLAPAASVPPVTLEAQSKHRAEASARSVGERRYLTVMFCDLVGSTGIAAGLDPEEWRDLVGAYLDAATAAVAEMGGHVAKILGDGLMALFGYPIAQENDAERAARASFAIQAALAELNRNNAGIGKPILSARIGLEAGPVVVDATGEIFGDAPNVAARVQALADPGAVLVTVQVQRHIAGLFVVEERGNHNLKGVPEPQTLFRLVRSSGGGRRAGQRQLTPLVGRDDEIAVLMRRWDRAWRGDGQFVMIFGEPGLGKSRLLEELHGRLTDTPHSWVEWSCSQLLQNTPLHPIGEWGRQRFGGAEIPAERRLADLDNALTLVKLDPAENAFLIAPLMDIPLPKERAPSLSPEELRHRQLAALTNWLIAGAKTQAIVLVVEDLHWADPTTLDVMKALAERGALAPLFLVATTRPEFRPPWAMRSHHGAIALAPLDRAHVRDMVMELSSNRELPRGIIDDVAQRTGGVPLFIEEVTRLLLERGDQDDGQVVPPTLQQSLAARLDRLGSAREAAQIGSVIGRDFSYSLLRSLADMDKAALEAALEKLVEADILLVQGLPPDSHYRFKHALIQDAAYENLLKSRRQVLHRRVAEALRDRFAETAEAEPESLAHHFTQAGMTDAAIEWWGKAGDQALRRSAFQEAIAHLGKAVQMVEKEGEIGGAGRREDQASRTSIDNNGSLYGHSRTKLHVDYARAMQWAKGFGAEEAHAAIERASEFAEAAPGQPEYWQLAYDRFAVSLVRGEFLEAREIAEAYLRQAEVEGRPEHEVAARRMLGTVKYELGEFSEARVEFERMLTNWDEQRDKGLRAAMGSDVLCVGWSYMAQLLMILGEIQNALRMSEDAIGRAKTLGDFGSLAFSLGYNLVVLAISEDLEALLHRAEAFEALAAEKGAPFWESLAKAWANRARGLLLGDAAAASIELEDIIDAKRKRKERQALQTWYGVLAELQRAAGASEAALAAVAEGMELAEQTASHRADSDLHRLRGDILARRDPASAEAAYRESMRIARVQGARTFELKAAHALARLCRSVGRSADGLAVLKPALDGFSPTPGFPEIEEAQTLLAVLGATEVETAFRPEPQLGD
jgi:class 3 adenylate cyclase